MEQPARFEVWFVTGSVNMYGEDALQRVADQVAPGRSA